MALELRTITADEVQAFRDVKRETFGGDSEDDPDGSRRMCALIDLSQAWAALDGGRVVGTAATFNLGLVVPGGPIDMAGLTMVTVHPAYRRRGLLRAFMRLHLDDARERGRALSGLWSSEASIYGRFGYGVAAEGDALEIEHAPSLALRPGDDLDEPERLDEAAARVLLPPLYARVAALRPGALVRTDVWWRERRFLEGPLFRGSASRRRHVLVRRDGVPTGYVVYRQRPSSLGTVPTGQVDIIELCGVDARADRSLWHFALHVDLFPKVTWWNAPVDDPLPFLVSDSRRIKRQRSDTLWLRIEDVARALEARRYAGGNGALRLTVEARSWELTLDEGRARCVPTTSRTGSVPELRMDRAALSALYLGGVSARRLARAGLLDGDAAAWDRLCSWPVPPWCPEVF